MTIADLRILIIEDELIYSRLLENRLKKKVAQIYTAANAAKATYYLKNEKLDLIFLDNLLPGTDGIDLIQDYKKQYPLLKIVFMSSVFSINDISIALKKGADFLLNKKNDFTAQLDDILKETAHPKEMVDKKNTKWNFTQFFKIQDPIHESEESKNIAIIEDEKAFLLNLKWNLKSISSNKSAEIVSFDDVDAFIKSPLKFDIVFTDYYPPTENGEGIIELIKRKTPRAKVIVLSGQTDPDVAITLKKDGADAYIVKDKDWKINVIELLDKMKAY